MRKKTEKGYRFAPVRERTLVEKGCLSAVFVPLGTRDAYFVPNGTMNRWWSRLFYQYIVPNGTGVQTNNSKAFSLN